MKSRLRVLILLILCIYGGSFVTIAQNLVPNPGYETIDICPNFFGFSGPSIAPPWVSPTMGSADIFNYCAEVWFVGAPLNYFGSQDPNTGDGYSGVYCKISPPNVREYIQAPLLSPLTAGTWYDVSFYVSLADDGCGIEKLGAYFSTTAPTSPTFDPLLFTPQVESAGSYLSDTENWTLISGCFMAEGGESFITLGNFHNDIDSPTEPGCPTDTAYYYFDDIMVMEGEPPEDIPFDLGGPEFACFSYVIDPGIDGYTYIWEDGTNGPVLEVTESGFYALTLTDGCNFGVDSIEVIIGGNADPIDIGPDALTLCIGETYTISLDPDLSVYTWQDGSNASEYEITSPGIYAVTLDDGCVVSEDQIEIDFISPPPAFSLGPDTLLCAGDEISFNFDPTWGDFLWQDNSTSATYTISGDGLYSLTISNMCGTETDEVLVTAIDIPAIELGPDNVDLCTGEFIEIEIDPSLGTILWQDGSSEPIYQITTTGVYSVSVTNQCGTGSDLVNVSFTEEPVIDLGADTLLCTGDQLILTATPGLDNYLWQDNSTAEVFVVNAEGVYFVQGSNLCGTDLDSIYVSYVPPLVIPDFGADVALCPGEQLVLYADNPGADIQWQDFTTLDSLVVTTPGEYFVLISSDCETLSDTILVNVNNNPPQLDLVDELLLCQGDAILLEAPVSGVNYLWSDGTTLSTILVTQPGTYSLTISNACGADQDTVVVTDGGPAPFVELGSDTSFCAGEMITLTPDNANIDSWLWGDGSTLSNFSISSPGQITVQVSNTCGTAYDTINATLLPAVPVLDLGADTAVCPGENVVLDISIPDVDILWSDGSTGSTLSTNDEGIYFASITNTCGVSYDTMEVTFLPDIPPLNLGSDQSLCPGETVTIDPGINGVDYLWHDGSTLATYSTTQQETIILTITNACGTNSDTLEVIENNQGPVVDLGPDILACEGEVISIPAGISGVNYLWQDGSTASTFLTSVSGEFILQVSNACGTDADTIIVDIHGTIPLVDLGSDTTLCEGEILVLTSSAISENTILWQDGSAGNTYTVSTAGTYSLFESNHCGEDTDTIIVIFTQAPEPFDLGADTILCPGESITLFAPNTSDEILWQDGSDQLMMLANQPQTYWLQISNACGLASDSIVVSFDHNTPALHLATSISFCKGDLITLDATQPFVANYLWSNGAITSSIDVSEPALYEVIVSTPCEIANTQVDVYPGDDCIVEEIKADVFIPNVFSPNHDGVNDEFVVFFGPDLNVIAMQGNIYDRWGNLVYSSDEIPFTWNGFFNENIVLPGVYVYTIKIISQDGNTQQESFFAGDVTVIR